MTSVKKKTTLATVKSFIKREAKNGNLYIKVNSSFDGMVDCVMPVEDSFRKVETLNLEEKNSLGIRGAWFVGHSSDSFDDFSDDNFIGYRVYNCCGTFFIAMKKLYRK